MLSFNEEVQIRRVFFHELGHYVCAKLNQKYFDGYGTDYIKIHRCSERFDEFCGETEPIKPLNYDEKKLFFSTLPEKLVGLIYGCVFQSYFTGIATLDYCFELHGIKDISGFRGLIIKHDLGRSKMSKLENLYHQHYKEIFENKSLKMLTKIEYLSLLIPSDKVVDEYFVKLDELDTALEEFIEYFKDIYIKIVCDFRNVIRD